MTDQMKTEQWGTAAANQQRALAQQLAAQLPSNQQRQENGRPNLQSLKDAVVEAATAHYAAGTVDPYALREAVVALRAAEEAAKKPRLRTIREMVNAYAETRPAMVHQYLEIADTWKLVEARDAEWIAALEKLARERLDGNRTVFLADILALVEPGQ